MTGKRGPGRPFCEVRQAYVERFKLTFCNPRNMLSDRFLAQLSLCRTDEARRILLGVSK